MNFVDKLLAEWRKGKLIQDWACVGGKVDELTVHEGRNYEVLADGENYTHPKLGTTVLPSNHPHGLLAYLTRLEESLDFLIRHGISTQIRDFNPPERVIKLIGLYSSKVGNQIALHSTEPWNSSDLPRREW